MDEGSLTLKLGTFWKPGKGRIGKKEKLVKLRLLGVFIGLGKRK